MPRLWRAAALSLLAAACGEPPGGEPAAPGPPIEVPPAAGPRDVAVLAVEGFGEIRIELLTDLAPLTAAHFAGLAERDYYDGTTFHRVIPGFMIQGGDPTGTGTGSGPRQLQSEFQAQKKHLRGVLSMARSSDPNSASCQFFIMHAAAPSLDNQYSAFGEVVTGMDAVDKIVNTPRGGNDKPKEPQTILEALVVRTQG
jgi:peptidyl-prolyl cis-trans isomerase B (cyclophilin B)